ncbi:toll/interleukin-1 receptor domain-containing protein [Ensifer sp. ENS11]|uniref:toll/interleukin-1 receptor domain-containing protein n=1 Tax=Ensifer sp. ENS11 TaxID=2769291 RepID=UPI00178043DD|nr:toll/interleukin-1 receptor domain-containing protein [Ensifer sp. ENS11]MBD9489932.1 toll/interleukin-1 receptor domain-containing protein [Ensifer sp. ENS11]
MSTFTESRIRQRAQQKVGSLRTAKVVLKEEVATAKAKSNFDIFLSHSTSDAEIILGVKGVLEDYGKTVYVDWLEDPQLDRANVTAANAELIRMRMRQCKSLVYVHTANSGSSKWMPWELGYFDGFNGAVAILPVTKNHQTSYQGQEYLGIYPYLDEAPAQGGTINEIWINKGSLASRRWTPWVSDPREFRKTS